MTPQQQALAWLEVALRGFDFFRQLRDGLGQNAGDESNPSTPGLPTDDEAIALLKAHSGSVEDRIRKMREENGGFLPPVQA